MITGIRSFYYPTKNIDRALQFYTEALGMTFEYEAPGWVALKKDGVEIGLHPEDREIFFIPRNEKGAAAGGCLTLLSDDIRADRQNLEAYGAKILGEQDEDWGHTLVFEDPDGNVLKLMDPK